MKQYIINHRAAYQILGALRGPDPVGPKNCETLSVLKEELTARIRCICFEREECHAIYKRAPVDQVSLNKIVGACQNLQPGVGVDHYLSHLWDAVRHTKEHEIWGTCAFEIVNLLAKTREELWERTGNYYKKW